MDWISIEDKMPEDGQKVLCYCQGNIYDVFRWSERENAWEYGPHAFISATSPPTGCHCRSHQ